MRLKGFRGPPIAKARPERRPALGTGELGAKVQGKSPTGTKTPDASRVRRVTAFGLVLSSRPGLRRRVRALLAR